MQRTMWLFDAEPDIIFLRLAMITMAAIGAVGGLWALVQILSGNT